MPSLNRLRRAYSVSRLLDQLESRLLLSASAGQIAGALDLPAGVGVMYTGNASAVQARTRPATGTLLGFPSGRDDDFLILSTGIATQVDTVGNTDGDQGTDLGPIFEDGDTATISFTLTVPASSFTQKVKFDFMFLSEEYPEYVGTDFNDFFTGSVNGVNIAKDQNNHVVDVNNVFFDGALSSAGTFFDGRTALLTASYTIPGGVTSVPIVLSIGDVGVGIYDSAVLLDNVRIETSQVVYLDFAGQSNLNFGGTTWNVPAFAATDLGYADNSNQQAVINAIVAKVTALYSGVDIVFTTTKPTTGAFSTVYIGGNDDALNPTHDGVLFGQGDSVDIGNLNRSDRAVVFSQGFGPFYSGDTADVIRDRISDTIAHEIGHILGLRHLDNTYTDDLMKKNSPRDPASVFHDQLRNLPSVENWSDAAKNQNDITYLKSILGTPGDASLLATSWSFLKALAGGFLALDLGALGTIYDAEIGTYNKGSIVGGELDADIAPQIIKVSKLSGVQTFFLPNFTSDDGFFIIGASKPGGAKDITTGTLDANGNASITNATVDYLDNSGDPLGGMALKKKDSQGNLQPLGSFNLVANALPKNTGTFVDDDGDIYTVKLTGPGTISMALDDMNSDGHGFIDQLVLTGTSDTKSLLSVTVKKAKAGDGIVNIGSISGTGVKSITATASNLTGTGINLVGQGLGSVVLRDVLNGADITAGLPGKSTSVTLHVVGNGTVMNFGGNVSTLKALAIGAGSITASAITTLSVTGAKGIAGNLLSNVTLTGAAATTVLGTLTVAGSLTGATVQGGVGNLGTIKLGATSNAKIITGINGTTVPAQLADFTSPATIKSVTITGLKGQAVSMLNTLIAARFITTFSATDPDGVNGASNVAADTIGSASVSFIVGGSGKRTKTSLKKLDDPLGSVTVQNVHILLL